MKSLITIVLMLINLSVIACTCSPIPEIKNEADLKPYEFIALVKVVALSSPAATNGWLLRDGDIKIEIIELFKGGRQTVINEPLINSSCNMGINLGEQWLFFGSKGKDKIEIGPCNYNVRYRAASGLRDWQSFRGMERLSIVKKLFYPVNTNLLNDTIRYDNGRPEIVQHFKAGKLQGERQIFYPTGQVYVKEKFVSGKRVGYRKIYALKGQLIYDVKYSGQYARKRMSYYDTLELKKWLPMDARFNKVTGEIYKADDPKIKIVLDSLSRVLSAVKSLLSYKTEYSNDGRSYISYGYNRQGKVINYRNVNSRKKLVESYRYNDDGSIQTYEKLDAVNNQTIEHDYHPNEARRDFLTACDFCFLYFDPKYDNGSKPEPIYTR